MTAERRTARLGRMLVASTLLVCVTSVAFAGDVIEKLNGQKLRGKVVKEEADSITFEIRMPGGGSLEMTVAKKDIHAITVKGERRILNAKPARQSRPLPRRQPVRRPVRPRTPVPKKKDEIKTRTPRQVLALIQKEGTTKPAWWDSVQLNHPPTLDLTWRVYGKQWDTSRHLSQYIFSIVCNNPSKFREGVKLLHKCLDVNKNDASKLDQTMAQLGNLYHGLLNDYARAAYWWGKTKNARGGISGNIDLGLADCYWRLGCKPMAVQMLGKFNRDWAPYGNVARLWSKVGEFGKALQMAENMARTWPDAGYLAAGDVCRYHGRHAQALQYYQKAVSTNRPHRNKRFKQRAQANLDAIKAFELLDLSRIRNGTYSGEGMGFRGQVYVDVTVKDAKIVSVNITRHKEDRVFSSTTVVPKRIVEKQGVKGVDAVTGATVTSGAIINAAAKALASGMK